MLRAPENTNAIQTFLFDQQFNMVFSIIFNSHMTILNDSVHADDNIPSILLSPASGDLPHVGSG